MASNPNRVSCPVDRHSRKSRIFGIETFFSFSDHVSLKYLESLKVSANNRLARWALALQPYKFQVHYKEEKKLTAADGISRRPFPEPTMTDDDDELAEDSFIMQIESDVFECTTEDDSDGRVDKQ